MLVLPYEQNHGNILVTWKPTGHLSSEMGESSQLRDSIYSVLIVWRGLGEALQVITNECFLEDMFLGTSSQI